MNSVSPVVPGFEHLEIVLAEGQPQYEKLPALRVNDGQMLITRWHFTLRERLAILFGRDLFLWTWTFGNPFQPVALDLEKPILEHPKVSP